MADAAEIAAREAEEAKVVEEEEKARQEILAQVEEEKR